eukprot:3115353-Prymnesium_polylepis.1
MHRANQRLSGKMRTKGPGGRMCGEVRRQCEASHTFASSQNSIPRLGEKHSATGRHYTGVCSRTACE